MTVSIVIISKSERSLDATLRALAGTAEQGHEVVVVDASRGVLDDIGAAHPWVRWIPFEWSDPAVVTIPHQRNVGVRAAGNDVVVFIDSGCVPAPGWLDTLLAPIIHGDEQVSCGSAVSPGVDIYGGVAQRGTAPYLDECPTINLAFRRRVFDEVGGFDESFEYGSDVDFSWRVVDRGYRIRNVPSAVVSHDWGRGRRQLRRAYVYGRARVRLYLKHRHRVLRGVRREPVIVAYPVYLVGLPVGLALSWPLYLALLAVPLWRSRRSHPVRTVVDHLVFGVGVLSGLLTALRGAR